MDNKSYYLALNRMNRVGPRTIQKLVLRWPNLQELFSLPKNQLIAAGLSEELAIAIGSFDFLTLEEDWRWQQEPQQTILTWDDPFYPLLLKEIPDPPPVLYVRGQLKSFELPAIAIVGTRKPSILGQETAWRFAYELAQHGLSIVSGLALGIDSYAHKGCLAALGKTIAVMGTGLKQIYPYRHRDLAEEIVENGLLVSEFPLKNLPIAGHFPRRNRIISGLSHATLVIEAAIKSGSLITARLALEQNREVLAVPGSIHNPQARGCHYLLQQGAKLVTSCVDVLEELQHLNLSSPIVDLASKLEKSDGKEGLASELENLVKCIEFESTTVDQIIARSGLKMTTVVCKLAELELQGFIKAVSGGYMRCKL